jgi:DNA-binding NarL/FixJ family response regulator
VEEGLLALESGDDARAVRRCEAVRAEAAEIDLPLARRRAAYLRLAVAVRTGGAAETSRAFTTYVRRHGPHGVSGAARWALRGGVPPGVVRELADGHHSPGLRCALLAAEGADEAAVAHGVPEADDVAWRSADTQLMLARCLIRLGHHEEARERAERAVTLLRRWPGWRHDEAVALLASLDTGALLTAREQEVIRCLAGGMTNQQVARTLGISIRTVTVHVSNLLRKTGSASRTEAALWALRHGMADRPAS